MNITKATMIKNRGFRLSINLYIFWKWVFSVACYVGFASCKTFGKQPKRPCFGRSPNAGCQSLVSLRRAATVCDWLQASLLGEGGSPTLSPGTDAGHVCPKALHDAEPTKHTQPFTGERGLGIGIINQKFISKTDFFYKLILFLITACNERYQQKNHPP